jgi:hypothetical protein
LPLQEISNYFHMKILNRLKRDVRTIFGGATTAVAASNRLYMATTLLVTTAEDMISVLEFLAEWEIVLGCALLNHDY